MRCPVGESEGGASTPPPNEHNDVPDERCAACGGAIDTNDWYPVTKQRDDDGTLHIYPFCSEACRDEWLAEHGE